jgi:diadenosine tetraphosphate (Ap4A) HIT family hydrolase
VSTFVLDDRLEADSAWIADGPLSQLRLMDDTRFAWLVLVPRREGASEWVDLDPADQALLWDEVRRACALLRADAACEKLNLGALGNIVRQLHVHVVARRVGDDAWPGPVWGSGAARRHAPDRLAARLAQLRAGWTARD